MFDDMNKQMNSKSYVRRPVLPKKGWGTYTGDRKTYYLPGVVIMMSSIAPAGTARPTYK